MATTASPSLRHVERGFFDSPRAFLLGVVMSIVFHGVLLLFFNPLTMPTEAIAKKQKQNEDKFVAVGLQKRQPQNTPKKQKRDIPDGPQKSSANQPAGRVPKNQRLTQRRDEVPKQPPVQPFLPGAGRKTIGAGPSLPSFFGGGDNRLVAPNGIKTSVGTAARGLINGTEAARFFQIGDAGKSIVYAVDRSGSMIHNNALVEAKRELIRSLNRLTPEHSFLVIFYDETPIALTLGTGRVAEAGGKVGLSRATVRNLAKIKQRIAAIRPKGGTVHIKALRAALKFQPDAIFFLTDANSVLNNREMNEIRILNKQKKTRIHCIEFGKGADLTGSNNFLKRLANLTGGKYRYRDVQEFNKR